jgi:hypothetical protein
VRTLHKIYKVLILLRIMSLETTLQGQRKIKPNRTRGIIMAIATACSVGLAALSLHPVVNPTVSEILEEKKFKEDYEKALFNYSREMYENQEQEKPSDLKGLLKGEILGTLNGRDVAFSEDGTARYLDNGAEVPVEDVIGFVKAYVNEYSGDK